MNPILILDLDIDPAQGRIIATFPTTLSALDWVNAQPHRRLRIADRDGEIARRLAARR